MLRINAIHQGPPARPDPKDKNLTIEDRFFYALVHSDPTYLKDKKNSYELENFKGGFSILGGPTTINHVFADRKEWQARSKAEAARVRKIFKEHGDYKLEDVPLFAKSSDLDKKPGISDEDLGMTIVAASFLGEEYVAFETDSHDIQLVVSKANGKIDANDFAKFDDIERASRGLYGIIFGDTAPLFKIEKAN